MIERLLPLARCLIGLSAAASLAEALLPKDGIAKAARVGIGIAYLGSFVSQIVGMFANAGG
ncbi:MAG: hypothetical protein IJP98_04230 [Clostridia bacterium]|nr:hypothetical protein [Clostridia bacterium]